MSNHRLKERRAELGLSQEELGRKIGVEGITVYRWEAGDCIPQRRLWPKIEKVMGLSIGEILGIEAPKEARRAASR